MNEKHYITLLWIKSCPPDSHVEALTPNVTVFGDGIDPEVTLHTGHSLHFSYRNMDELGCSSMLKGSVTHLVPENEEYA